MNDTLNTIKTRYSCRDFKSTKLTDDQLEALTLSAVQSPSGMNSQPWRIIAVTNEDLLRELEILAMGVIKNFEDKSMYERMMSRGGTVFYHTPCMIFIAGLKNSALNCGIVCENIALAATSMGLGNVICGLAGNAFASPKGEELKAKLGFPEEFEFMTSVLVGYSNKVAEPHAPDLSKISYIK